MKTLLKTAIALSLVTLVFVVACKKDDDPIKETKKDPIDTTGIIDTVPIDNGPQDGDYDFYIAMSYSDPQPSQENMNKYYILIACEDSLQAMETVEMKIQGVDIPLEYANYGGPDFYIAYFNLEFADTFHYELTMNGVLTEVDMATPTRLITELPMAIEPDQNIELSWEITKDPRFMYIEGFQREENFEEIKKSVEYLKASTRNFTVPADWLWSEENVDIRDIYLGIMNYKIENKVCFTLSDGVYKSYQ